MSGALAARTDRAAACRRVMPGSPAAGPGAADPAGAIASGAGCAVRHADRSGSYPRDRMTVPLPLSDASTPFRLC